MKRIALCLLCAVLVLSAILSGCAKQAETPAQEAPAQEAPAQTPAQDEPEAENAPAVSPVTEEDAAGMPDIFSEPAGSGSIYVSDGLKLAVPDEYSGLVQVAMGTPLFGSDNLFSVRETASTEAAEKAHPGEDWGEGALFGIGRMTEDEVHELMCTYLNNERVFARDAENNYYVIFRPSDVRFYRENMENLQDSPDVEQWTRLNEWAAGVTDSFIELNGLEAWNYRGTSTELMLSHIAYKNDLFFMLNSLDYGELYPEKPEPSAGFAAQLLENVDFEYCGDEVEAPDGEYFVIDFPNDGTRLDIFKGGDYIREDYGDFQMLLKVTGPTEGYCADVMDQWCRALQAGG